MKQILCLILLLISYPVLSQHHIVRLKGTVKSSNQNEPVSNVYLHLTLEKGSAFEQKTDSTGSYEFIFPLDSPCSYTLSIASDKHTVSKSFKNGFLASKASETGKLESNSELTKNFSLVPVPYCGPFFPTFLYQANSIITCNDSLYKSDSLQYSYLNNTIFSLVTDLKEHPELIVEIQGHASTIEKDHEHLALYRAQIIREILISKGIHGRRLIAKGNGNHKPLFKDDVIKKAKTKEEKMALHLRNQRVVFRVISWDYIE